MKQTESHAFVLKYNDPMYILNQTEKHYLFVLYQLQIGFTFVKMFSPLHPW